MTSTVPRDLSGLVFLRREALADGYTDRAIKRMVDSGQWHRIRAGAYVATETWRTLNAADRHRLTARAVLRTSHPSTVLSHTSAALEHGAPVWGLDLAEVHVTRTMGSRAAARPESCIIVGSSATTRWCSSTTSQ